MATTFTGTFSGALTSDNTLILGTCSLGSTYGQVKSASLKRSSDLKEIKSCKGGIRAVLMQNPKTVLNMKCIFDTAATLPQIGSRITLPLISVTAVVTDVSVEWEEDGERMLSMDATGWDALTPTTMYAWDGSSMTSTSF